MADAKEKPVDIAELQRKARTLDAIHAELDGTEWDSGTTSVVASHLIGAGYVIRPYETPDEEDDDGGR